MTSTHDEETSPRVAIVVTCFNSGSTISDTIASIRSNGAAVELVVVDDGSTDNRTHDVLAELQDSGITVIRRDNQGQAAAAMTGVAATGAPYVMRFDSDDLLEKGAVGALADALDQEPDAAVAWGDFQTFGLTTFTVPGPPAFDPWLLTYVNLVPGSGALIRRSALDSAGGWRLPDGFEDWDLWMSFAELRHTGIYVPRTIFRYRRHGSSRQALNRQSTTSYYETLLRLHPQVQRHRRDWARSPSPAVLKLLISIADALPRLSRLSKINMCEFLARSLWSHRRSAALEMARQGAVLRVHELLRGR